MTKFEDKVINKNFGRKVNKFKTSLRSENFRKRFKGDLVATATAVFGIFLIIGIFGASILINDYLNAQNAKAGYILGIREALR